MKLFKCTVECRNSCYVETLLIVAEDIEDAKEQVKAKRRDKYNENPHIVYTCPMREIDLDLNKKGILEVGFGHSESDYGSDD